MAFPANVSVGHNFPVTSHSVKYSHHPGSRAHFSLTGKVRASIGKSAVPLDGACGHLFTVMVQGLEHFQAVGVGDVGNAKRGVVPFGFDGPLPVAAKFSAFLYSASECARRIRSSTATPWLRAISPDGQSRVGVVLATPYEHGGQRYFLLLTVDAQPLICAEQSVWLSLLGGFDLPEQALDHAQPTSFLMCIYPASDSFDVLAKRFGTIDLAA